MPFLCKKSIIANGKGDFMKKLSIIIPVHNTALYLPTCLNSVLNQTEESIEVIAVNDHSKDLSLEILKYFEKIYPYKLKVINLTNQHGVSCARNEGLKIAQGEYIGFVDSDDIVSLNMFGDFYIYAKKYDAQIVSGSFFQVSNNEYRNEETYIREKKKPTTRNYLKQKGYPFFESPAVWDKIFSHDLIGDTQFLENCIYEDVGFTYFLLLKAKEIIKIDRNDYAYRTTPGSIMQSIHLIKSNIMDIIFVCVDAISNAQKSGFNEQQMQILRDLLKNSLFSRIFSIKNWDLKEKEKIKIMDDMLSIANYYMENILKIETKFGSFGGKKIEGLFKENTVHDIKESQINHEISTLKRKILKLERKQNSL